MICILKTRSGLGLAMLLWLLAAWLLMPVHATAQYSQLVVFGDSLSDTGNFYAETGTPPCPPYGGFPACLWFGRFSNGPIWVDVVADALGLSANNSKNGGTNFAVAGAQTGHTNTNGNQFGGLLDQIAAFLATLKGGRADPDALYVVWAGADDFRAAPSSTTIPSAVTNLVIAIGALAERGARTIVVPTQPPLGNIPEVLAAGNPVLSARLSALTAAFDGALTRALASSRLKVVRVNIYRLLREVAGNPSRFGLTNATEPCLDPYTFAVCDEPDDYAFWDLIHPTTQAHAIIADRILREVE